MNPAEILGQISALRLEAARAGYQVALSGSGQFAMVPALGNSKPVLQDELSVDESRVLVDNAAQAGCVLQVGDTCYHAHTQLLVKHSKLCRI
jgi:precorrin-6B methylase 1